MGFTSIQERCVRQLEQLHINTYKYIIPFLQDYFYLTCKSGNTFNKDLGERLFTKLPGPLGIEITERWRKTPMVVGNPNGLFSIGIRINFIYKIVWITS